MDDMADDVCQRCGEHEHYGCSCTSLELANFWAERASAQQKRIDELEQHIADMIDDSGQECACGYDNPTDVCLGHKPMFDRMQKRIDALTEALEPFSCAHDYSTDLNRLKPDANCRPHDMVISREFRKAFEALQPSTTEEKT